MIAVPHFMWKVNYTGRFNFFVGLVKQLDRLRDGSTGDYRPINFAIIKKLEKEFEELRKLSIFTKYILKLVIQLIIIAGSLSVNIVVFKISDFTVVFECPSNFNDLNVTITGWPYSFSVECTYPPFRLLSKIEVMDYILLIFALITVLYGLAMCFKCHRNALGHQDVAKFSFMSFLSPEDHVFKRFQLFSPCIKDDLDFLLLKLFCTDTGHGRVFKDVQVCKKLDYLFCERKDKKDKKEHGDSCDEEYICNKTPVKLPHVISYGAIKRAKSEKEHGDICDEVIKEYIHNKTPVKLAHVISFGAIRRGVQFAPKFEKIVSVNFHPHYGGITKKKKYHGNKLSIINLAEDIYSQDEENIKKSDDLISEEMNGETIDWIILGPFKDKDKETVNIHIKKLRTLNNIKSTTRMITIRPTKIGHKDVSKVFHSYSSRSSHEKRSSKIVCNKTRCEFELREYTDLS